MTSLHAYLRSLIIEETILQFENYPPLSHKVYGYEGLYYAIVANQQLYNSALPFIVANRIAQLTYSLDGNVASEAKAFLVQTVNPIIASVVFQHSGQKLPYQDATSDGFYSCSDKGLSYTTP